VAVKVCLYGSFAQTYRGHGTDRALVAGLLGRTPADERIRHSLRDAQRRGVSVRITMGRKNVVHPNTAKFFLRTREGDRLTILGASLGGGQVVVSRIGDYEVQITGDYHTLLVEHLDRPGMIATVTVLLAKAGLNVAQMSVSRKRRGGRALMLIKADQHVPRRIQAEIGSLAGVVSVRAIEPIGYH